MKVQEVFVNIDSLCRVGGWTASQGSALLAKYELIYTHYFLVFGIY